MGRFGGFESASIAWIAQALVMMAGSTSQAADASGARPEPPLVPFMTSTSEPSFLSVDCDPTDEPSEFLCRFTQLTLSKPKEDRSPDWTESEWIRFRKMACALPDTQPQPRKLGVAVEPVKSAREKLSSRSLELCACKTAACANALPEPPRACTLSVNTFSWVLRSRGANKWVFAGPGTGICEVDFLVTLERKRTGWTFSQHRTADTSGSRFCNQEESLHSFTSEGQLGNVIDLSMQCPTSILRVYP